MVGDFRDADGEATVAAIRSDGGDATFVHVDVTSSAEVRALVEAAEGRYGRLDIVTANAGILGRCTGKPLVEATEDEIDEVMAVNFGGVYLTFEHAIPALLGAGGGAMTATASLAARLGYANLDAYCASKGAVVALAHLFLVSDEASFISGHDLVADAGWSVIPA